MRRDRSVRLRIMSRELRIKKQYSGILENSHELCIYSIEIRKYNIMTEMNESLEPQKKKKENPFVSIIFNIVLPFLVLSKLTSADYL